MTPRHQIPYAMKRETGLPIVKCTDGTCWMFWNAYVFYFTDQYFDHRPGNIDEFMKANAVGRYGYIKQMMIVDREEDAALVWMKFGGTEEQPADPW